MLQDQPLLPDLLPPEPVQLPLFADASLNAPRTRNLAALFSQEAPISPDIGQLYGS